MSENDNMLIFTNSYGEEETFKLLDIIEYQKENYVVLLPYPHNAAHEVVILKIENTNEYEENYVSIDDNTTEIIFNLFKERLKEKAWMN